MKLSDLIKTETIEIPGTDISVTVRTDMPWFQFLEMCAIADPVERGIFSVKVMVQSWKNLTDDEGNLLEVNEENLRKLPITVMQHIAAKLDDFVREHTEKKTN